MKRQMFCMVAMDVKETGIHGGLLSPAEVIPFCSMPALGIISIDSIKHSLATTLHIHHDMALSGYKINNELYGSHRVPRRSTALQTHLAKVDLSLNSR